MVPWKTFPKWKGTILLEIHPFFTENINVRKGSNSPWHFTWRHSSKELVGPSSPEWRKRWPLQERPCPRMSWSFVVTPLAWRDGKHERPASFATNLPKDAQGWLERPFWRNLVRIQGVDLLTIWEINYPLQKERLNMNHFCDGDLLLKSQRSTLSQSSRPVVLLLGYVDRQISRVLKVLIFAKSEWLVTNKQIGFWILSVITLLGTKIIPSKRQLGKWVSDKIGGICMDMLVSWRVSNSWQKASFCSSGVHIHPKQGGVDANYQVCRPKSNFLCCLCEKRPFSYAFPFERDHRLWYFETFTSHPGDPVADPGPKGPGKSGKM